ncbi:MAG: precorrin-3B C(17)-methyltransferase [Candidatus Hodarchaeota archaeon]
MPSQGKLYVVGIGPGFLDYMTIKAKEVILGSEYIIGNELYLEQIKALLDGKKVISGGMGSEVEKAKKAAKLAENHVVSVISGGDANVYGMAGIVLEVAQKKGLNVEIEVVPGVTAATAVGSRLGAPIMGDFVVISLSDLLTPWEVIEKRLKSVASTDFITIIYNPKSKKRNTNFQKAIKIIREHRSKNVPVGIVKNCMRDGENVIITTLDEVLEYDNIVDMRTTIIIGNSESIIWNNKIITRRGYHRKYTY